MECIATERRVDEDLRGLARTNKFLPEMPAMNDHDRARHGKLHGMKICSLLPSATEILFALGLGDQIVGVSHECDFPPEARTKRVLIVSRISHTESAAAIDRQVREFLERGERLYSVDLT